MKVPVGLEYTTADSVAECLSYHKHLDREEAKVLCRKLWGFVRSAKNRTRLGGDGSDGTREVPGEALSKECDDTATWWWHKLSKREQEAITKAWEEENKF